MHTEALLRSGSESLATLIANGWRECSEGIIDWTTYDFETVQRVITYCYLKDYKAPDPVPHETRAEKPNEDGDVDILEDQDLGLQVASQDAFAAKASVPPTPPGKTVKGGASSDDL